jgi:hypothetical protein
MIARDVVCQTTIMSVENILAALDIEIETLQRARQVLTSLASGKRRKAEKFKPAGKPANKRKRRKLSAEARARIAEAQRKRWAKLKASKK